MGPVERTNAPTPQSDAIALKPRLQIDATLLKIFFFHHYIALFFHTLAFATRI